MSSDSSSVKTQTEGRKQQSEKRARPTGNRESIKRTDNEVRSPRSTEEDGLEQFYSNAFVNDMQTLKKLSGADLGGYGYGSNTAARRTSDKRREGKAGSLKRKKS